MRKSQIACLLISVLSMKSPLCSDYGFYTVEKDDNLSTILYELNLKPLYGKNGTIELALELNPWLKNNAGQLIYKDQKIWLPIPGKNLRKLANEDSSLNKFTRNSPNPEMGPETVPQPIPAEASEFLTQSKILASMGYDFFRIDARDKETKDTASIISTSSPKVSLTWELLWSENWSSEFGLQYRQDNIINDTKSQKTLSKTTYGRMSTYFGINRLWSNRNKTQIFVGRSERGFLRSESATKVKLDSATSTDVGVKHEAILFANRSASAGIEMMMTYLGAATAPGYSVDAGHLARGSVFMRHQMKTFSIEARGSYTTWEQNSVYVEEKAKEVGTSLAVGWTFE